MTTTDTAINPADELVNAEDLARVIEQRASTYALLSRLYRTEVDEPFLAELKGMRFPAATGNAKADAGYRDIATYLANTWENSLEELRIDYTRTFLGNGIDSFSAAYPFESVYTSEKRLTMQDARDEVLAIYRSTGMDKDESWHEGEDHLAVETEFMSTIAQRSADALRKGDEEQAARLLATQRNFLEDHIASWVPMLTPEMRRFSKTGFYHGLSKLTEGFIEIDREFLNEIVDTGEENEADGESDTAAC